MNEDDLEVELGDDGFEEDGADPSELSETSLDDYFAAHQQLRVVYQTASYFLPQIVSLIGAEGKITLRPEYQRRIRWNEEKKSALIESMLLNIPIPPIYLYENDAARYEVMDGQQRLNAIREFHSGQLKLGKLRILRRLNGLTYSECPQRVIRALDRASVSAIVLLLESDQSYPETPSTTPNDLRRRVFDRLNTRRSWNSGGCGSCGREPVAATSGDRGGDPIDASRMGGAGARGPGDALSGDGRWTSFGGQRPAASGGDANKPMGQGRG